MGHPAYDFPFMSLRSSIDIVAMLVCSVYGTIPLFWLVVHPFIDTWRRRGRRAFSLILPIWAVFIIAAFLLVWPHRSVRFYAEGWCWFPAALLLFTGLSIYRQAFRGFHRSQVSGLDELEPDRHRQELVTNTGFAQRVRHPIPLDTCAERGCWVVRGHGV